MSLIRWSLILGLMLVPALRAQQLAPHIGYVYPAGGRQDSTFQVTVGGQFLDGVANVYVSGSGVRAEVIEHVKPLTQAQFNKLRDQLRELMEKQTPESQKAIAELRAKLAAFVRRPANPAIAETAAIRMTLAPDAAPGDREIRLGTPMGLTNPMVFRIGQLQEYSEPAAKVSAEPLPGQAARFRNQQTAVKPAPPTDVTLPAVLNGQVMPGGVDRYRFRATKGQHLVAAASARELIPYISDAVPGWFQATLALYDAKGKEMAFADDFRFHPDPVLHFEIPEDGEYLLAIRDSIYRGREDFVYRITAGELPFVTGIFPLGGKSGSRTTLEVTGWNLPEERAAQTGSGGAAGFLPFSVRKGDWVSNQVPFSVDTLPERTEQEPNGQMKGIRPVKLPVTMNGRIDPAGDLDVFRFEGRAGQEIVAEVLARRIESPLDSLLKLTDAKGRQLAANDDHEDPGTGLLTHHADSYIRFTLPANGTYYLHLSDTQRKGGAEYAYRLRISPPAPDYELRVVPASINLRPGGTVPITLHALRKDGFAGDIALRLDDAPDGFKLSGGWIPAGLDKVRVTLTAPPVAESQPIRLRLEGRAEIRGRDVSRPAVPAEDMMQAFAYRHLVPAKECMVQVVGTNRRARVVPLKLHTDKPVRLPSGGSAPVLVSVPRWWPRDQLQLTLREPPEGIGIRDVSLGQQGLAILLQADAGKVKPGQKGNLIVDALLESSATPAEGKQRAAGRRQPLGTLPAISFEIVQSAGPRK